jgi:hypothetical protein
MHSSCNFVTCFISVERRLAADPTCACIVCVCVCHFRRTKSEARVARRLHALFVTYDVAIYANGHDHNMQHFTTHDNVHYYVNGVGGFDIHKIDAEHNMWPPAEPGQETAATAKLVWGSSEGFGFVRHTVDRSGLHVEFLHAVHRDTPRATAKQTAFEASGTVENTGADVTILESSQVVHSITVEFSGGGLLRR